MNFLIAVFIIGAIISMSFYFLYKRYRDFDNKLDELLEEHELKFLSSKPAPFFKFSPFSNKVKTRGVYYETTILGLRGEEVFLRIVEFENKDGKRYKSWVSIWTSLFIVRDVEWEIKLDTVNSN